MKYWFYKPHGIVVVIDKRGNSGSYHESCWGVRCVAFTNPKFGNNGQVGLFITNIHAPSEIEMREWLRSREGNMYFEAIPHFKINYYRHNKTGELYRELTGTALIKKKYRRERMGGLYSNGKIIWLYPQYRGNALVSISEQEFNMELDKIKILKELQK